MQDVHWSPQTRAAGRSAAGSAAAARPVTGRRKSGKPGAAPTACCGARGKRTKPEGAGASARHLPEPAGWRCCRRPGRTSRTCWTGCMPNGCAPRHRCGTAMCPPANGGNREANVPRVMARTSDADSRVAAPKTSAIGSGSSNRNSTGSRYCRWLKPTSWAGRPGAESRRNARRSRKPGSDSSGSGARLRARDRNESLVPPWSPFRASHERKTADHSEHLAPTTSTRMDEEGLRPSADQAGENVLSAMAIWPRCRHGSAPPPRHRHALNEHGERCRPACFCAN